MVNFKLFGKYNYVKIYLVCWACIFFYFVNGQSDTIVPAIQRLEPILIKATKTQKSWQPTTNSVYVIIPKTKDQLVQNSLQEYLLQSPSIFALNANNKAQDLRIAIRGFGSRAAFGVRGVKIIVDGIPETTTDGQGQLDNLNLGIIDRIEILNNGSSSLYGNASGGVINILTINENALFAKDRFLYAGLGFQSFKGQQHQLTIGQQLKKTSVLLHVNNHLGNGYRDHSAFASSNQNVRVVHKFSPSNKLEAIVNSMLSLKAEDPGGLTVEQFDSLPTAARDSNLQFKAGELIYQFKSSLRYEGNIGKDLNLNTYAFYSKRNFLGSLPFSFGGIIDLNRNFFGHGTSLTKSLKKNNIKWTAVGGYELSTQRDFRERFINEDGEKGDTTLAQKEQFTNAGFYAINDVSYDKLNLSLALRYDINFIKIVDEWFDLNDNSGSINLNDFNYSIGLAYQIADSKNLFMNYSTSFETPTLNELSNNPDGSGFNPNLKAQTAQHLELGIKGYLQQKTAFQISLFKVASKNELLPFEVDSIPGRTFFRNVGSTDRLGLELFVQYPISKAIELSTNWSFNHFTFKDYELDGVNFKDNKLPGLPNFQGFIQMDFTFLKGMQLNFQNQVTGKIFMNDENDAFQEPKIVSNISLKYTVDRKRFKLFPYVGVNNIFQTKYADNIRINAFGNRFYEAAPNILFYGGLRLGI